MALIKCKDCGKEFSTDAKVCPNCGAKKPKAKTRWEPILITFAVVYIIALLFPNSSNSTQTTVTAEKTSTPDKVTEEQKDAAMQVIQINGYTCDSIAGMIPFITSEGYNVYCNDHRYSYEIENKGGNWVVTVK